MLIEIRPKPKHKINPDIYSSEMSIYFTAEGPGQFSSGEDFINFYSQPPVLRKKGKLYECLKEYTIQQNDLEVLENELCGFSAMFNKHQFSLTMFSSKMSRLRLFYCINSNGLFISEDLRRLLQFSKKELNLEMVYGIIKFGELPEKETLIRDINTIPCSHFTIINDKNIREILNNNFLPPLKPYHHIKYPCDGGCISKTKDKLVEILSFLHQKNPYLMVSGGIDSSLLNYLYNEITDSPYPVIYYDFDESASELSYVKKSLQGTKAEMIQVKMRSGNLVNEFQKSIEKLVYPVYDNGSAYTGQLFNTSFVDGNQDLTFIDGTVADSLYGVRDYSVPLVKGQNQHPIKSYIKEFIFAKMLKYGFEKNKTGPRDSYLDDEFLQDLLWYAGPYANLWFSNAKQYTQSLVNKYRWYYTLIDSSNRSDYWARYTVQKMFLYAAKQTTVKAIDILSPNQVYFPFMFTTVVEDQGHYTWGEKSENGIIKAPLKRILEEYATKEFIYRKKVGMQSQTRKWINLPSIKPYFSELISRPDGIAFKLMGRKK
jgi:hypothetical protein